MCPACLLLLLWDLYLYNLTVGTTGEKGSILGVCQSVCGAVLSMDAGFRVRADRRPPGEDCTWDNSHKQTHGPPKILVLGRHWLIYLSILGCWLYSECYRHGV